KQISIPAYSQPNNQTLRFVLLIRSSFDPLRTATTTQIIVFSSSRRLIDINIACVSNCNGNKYTITSHIHLKGQCIRCRNKKIIKWKWCVGTSVVHRASSRLIYFVKDALASRLSINLDVEAKHRLRPSFTYRGSSWIYLEKNTGPTGTTCNVNPQKGDALETLFLIKCIQSHARFKPLKYCVGITRFLVEECKTDEMQFVRLPPTTLASVKVC
ncbi:polycystin family receptor for egg jelly-like, partial [Drosophila tropicalis]|uniref:polycystin family receptor for egg jelly-like n=1 Tax=Drosophila tropicalis TaxID=46794 RepID=UPI0035ABAD4C